MKRMVETSKCPVTLPCKVLFDLGGGCRVCGSVEHKQTDCPEKQRKKIEGI